MYRNAFFALEWLSQSAIILIMNKGIIRFIAIFIILILLVSAFKVNLRGYLESTPEDALDSNVVLIIQTGKVIWADYIRRPVNTVWYGYVIPFVKGEFLSGLKSKLEKGRTLPEG